MCRRGSRFRDRLYHSVSNIRSFNKPAAPSSSDPKFHHSILSSCLLIGEHYTECLSLTDSCCVAPNFSKSADSPRSRLRMLLYCTRVFQAGVPIYLGPWGSSNMWRVSSKVLLAVLGKSRKTWTNMAVLKTPKIMYVCHLIVANAGGTNRPSAVLNA